jgi:hypothetical protein
MAVNVLNLEDGEEAFGAGIVPTGAWPTNALALVY